MQYYQAKLLSIENVQIKINFSNLQTCWLQFKPLLVKKENRTTKFYPRPVKLCVRNLR